MDVRPLTPEDVDQALEVLEDAVLSQAAGLYTPAQVQAWAGHGRRSPELRQALLRGRGLVSCGLVSWGGSQHSTVEALALLDPIDRLSLLYCRGRSSRQGRASKLLNGVEMIARAQGCHELRTEASQLSRPLLERHGWQVDAEETALYAGVLFVRWRMIKAL
jgi:putative acetyltransferase